MPPPRPSLLSLSLSACNTHVFSPPSGSFPLESAATVGARQRSAGADLSYASAVFGPAASSYRLSYRQGLSEQLEVSAAPSMIWLSDSRSGDSHPGIYALRGALKYAPIPHVSGAFGLGAGASAAGAFVSPDLGLTLSWENRYVIPLLAGRFFLSAPISPRSVHFTTDDDSSDGAGDADDAPDQHRRTPRFTYGFQVSTGLRVPLWRDPARKLKPAVSCAFGATFLYDRTPKHEGLAGFSCGFDLTFDALR